MKKKLAIVGIMLMLLTIAFSGCFENKKEIGFIQNLINNASEGDTINIPRGTYYENIVIDKTINLIGEDENTTIINANDKGDVLYISADHVKISGFTIQNSSLNCGITIRSNYSVITNNSIKNNLDGIDLYKCSNNTISNNIIVNNGDDGITLSNSNSNTISNNIINNNYFLGINVYYYSSNNIISGNTINNNLFGVYFVYYSNSNAISGNTVKYNNWTGIDLEDSSNNIIYKNTIQNNNRTGIKLSNFYSFSDGNIIYHNNLMDNTPNANDTGDNTWHNATLKEGNYWDDYNGTDANSDGIGDTPYNVTGGDNQDRYPLMNPVTI